MIKHYPTLAELAVAAADKIEALATQAIAEQGHFSVALAGGSTPRAIHQALAAKNLDWGSIQIFWGDERCVPPDHPESNYRMALETLLNHISIPPENIHPIQGDIDPAQAATEYEHQLRMFLGATPRFDLILLGMGDDGHTASLFPHTAAIHEQTRWVVGHYVEKLDTWRISLTPFVINQAAQVIFLVVGGTKAAILRQVLQGPYQPDTLPAQIVQPTNGGLLWLVDAAAGALLNV